MSQEVQLRRGTTSEHSGFTGAEGELTYDVETKRPVIHDGITQGGFPLALQGNFIEGDGSVLTIVKLTQDEYDALSFRNPLTLYVIAPKAFLLDSGLIQIFGSNLDIDL